MAVELNHIIIPSNDKVVSSKFLADILGLEDPKEVGHFMALTVSNGVTLDYDNRSDFDSQHCAFLVSDDEYDTIYDRVLAAGITYYADPGRSIRNETNTRSGGRGFYFDDPDGHLMEVFTVVPLI